ncbi:MAG: hypothetical protein H6Q33_3346 [Deltaproteobacteria bacterium]|nr:hypothetical protein [Deltaproteobacteria bacterium]
MGVLDTLSYLLAGDDTAASRDAAAALMRSYIDCARRTAQLERHAKMAPHTGGAQALERLAAEDADQGLRLRRAVEAAGASLPSMAAELPQRDGLNHWARLVDDLDAHQRCVMQARELALRLAARLPQTAALFESLYRAEAIHCEKLRALIARADPQALD